MLMQNNANAKQFYLRIKFEMDDERKRRKMRPKVVTATAICLIFRALDLNGQPIIYSLANEVP